MKNNVSAFDAYRIYTGHRFSRSFLSALLIAAILGALFAVYYIIRFTTSDIRAMIEDMGMTDQVREWISFYIYDSISIGAQSAIGFGMFIMIIKKVLNSDMSDRNAAGGKFFLSAANSRSSFIKAHILADTELLIFIIILYTAGSIISSLSMLIYADSTFSEWMDLLIAETVHVHTRLFSSFVLIPLAVINFCELMPMRLQRMIMSYILGLASMFILATSDLFENTPDMNILFVPLGLMILAASEYIVIRNRDARIAGEPAAA